jgi:hypothetical protein
LTSGIARNHGVLPKQFFGVPSILLPPPKKNPFSSKEQRISLEREFGASQNRQLQENVYNHAKPRLVNPVWQEFSFGAQKQ